MNTEQQIERLAGEYGKYRRDHHPNPMVVAGGNVGVTIAASYRKEAEEFLRWLLEGRVVVEKCKVRELYRQTWNDEAYVGLSNDWALHNATERLESIFGKELFNEEEI